MTAWLAGRGALIIGGGPAAGAVARTFEAAGAVVIRAEADAEFATGCTADALADYMDALQAQSAAAFSILVMAALPPHPQSSEAISFQSWRATMALDLDMRFLAAAELARRRIAARLPGAILHLLPRSSMASEAGNAALATAAAGIENMVKTLATEWARDGIRSNAIVSRIAVGGTVDELSALGRLALYLCSDYAAYVTGCVMGVNEI